MVETPSANGSLWPHTPRGSSRADPATDVETRGISLQRRATDNPYQARKMRLVIHKLWAASNQGWPVLSRSRAHPRTESLRRPTSPQIWTPEKKCVSVSRRSSQCFTLTGSNHIRPLPASFTRSASGTWHTDTCCLWGPWARCIMTNNAVNVSALSCRVIQIGAGLNHWYRPRAKLLKTPLVKATRPSCRLTLNKHLKVRRFRAAIFAAALSLSKHPRGQPASPSCRSPRVHNATP